MAMAMVIVMAGQRRGEKHPGAHIVRNATSIRSRPSDCCRAG